MLLTCDSSDHEAGMKLLEDLTTNANRVQQQVLDEILAQNARTKYMRGFLNGHSDKQLFKEKVPIVNYEDIKHYIDQIANGEPSDIISAQPIIELLLSSGTSGGRQQLIPLTAEELGRRTFFLNLLVLVMNKYVDGLDQGKGMYLLFSKAELYTPSGLAVRPSIASYYNSSNFRNRPFNRFNDYTSPDETILCLDNKQSMYCQLLCGLVRREEVLRVGAVFASALFRAIKFLEDYWPELCSNIRTGRLSDWITDPACRNAASLVISDSNSDLADLIELECTRKSWEGIIKKLWPKTKYIEAILMGTMAQYVPTLEFYGGGIPLVSVRYSSSECYLGINLRPLSKPCDVSYTLLPNMAYFEFLPVEEKHERLIHEVQSEGVCDRNCIRREDEMVESTDTVDLAGVKLGHCYELVVTTFTGLYRYRMGDILKVTGFHNNAPEFQFVRRRNVVLSVDADKTNEEDLFKAVAQAKLIVEPLGFLLTEYTSYADTCSLPGHYVLFWELNSRGKSDDDLLELDSAVMEQCCLAVEESLDALYRKLRRRGDLGPLEIRVVKYGAFGALMDFYVSKLSSVGQYKTPRCIKSEEAVRVLDLWAVGRFFSRKVPFWDPYPLQQCRLNNSAMPQ